MQCRKCLTLSCSTVFEDVESYGWEVRNGKLEVQWDINVEQVRKELTSRRKPPVHKCACQSTQGKCSGNGRGCLNCAKSCRPCHAQCKCKGNCDNPHNNGWKCTKCDNSQLGIEDSDSGDESTEQISSSASSIIPDMDTYFPGNNFYVIPDASEMDSESDTDNI